MITFLSFCPGCLRQIFEIIICWFTPTFSTFVTANAPSLICLFSSAISCAEQALSATHEAQTSNIFLVSMSSSSSAALQWITSTVTPAFTRN
ncbi:hypothetical protein, partial [Escherichia coli]|uniref:hypothetical protein n=1 Tax=Escherichia coli TaxID=562 RepID=UPI002878A7B6